MNRSAPATEDNALKLLENEMPTLFDLGPPLHEGRSYRLENAMRHSPIDLRR